MENIPPTDTADIEEVPFLKPIRKLIEFQQEIWNGLLRSMLTQQGIVSLAFRIKFTHIYYELGQPDYTAILFGVL